MSRRRISRAIAPIAVDRIGARAALVALDCVEHALTVIDPDKFEYILKDGAITSLHTAIADTSYGDVLLNGNDVDMILVIEFKDRLGREAQRRLAFYDDDTFPTTFQLHFETQQDATPSLSPAIMISKVRRFRDILRRVPRQQASRLDSAQCAFQTALGHLAAYITALRRPPMTLIAPDAATRSPSIIGQRHNQHPMDDRFLRWLISVPPLLEITTIRTGDTMNLYLAPRHAKASQIDNAVEAMRAIALLPQEFAR